MCRYQKFRFLFSPFLVRGRVFAMVGAVFSVLTLHLAAKAPKEDAWGIWTQMPALEASTPSMLRPEVSSCFRFNLSSFQAAVSEIEQEKVGRLETPTRRLMLPRPDGSWMRVTLIESPVLSPALAKKFPTLKSYRGVSSDDPTARIRISVSEKGLRAQVLSERGTFYIDPHLPGHGAGHLSYYRKDLKPNGVGWLAKKGDPEEPRPFQCSVRHPLAAAQETPAVQETFFAQRTGETLRTFRIAIAATGEYTAYHGGSVQDGMAALNDLVTRVTGIYENEIAVRLVLVANNDLIVYTNAGTDPYGADPINDVQADIDSKIGNANYDVGHVVSTGSGGVAALGSAGVNSFKAQGYTGLNNPVGDPFWVDYVAHEIGHQFGANHTYNGSGGSCGGNRNAATAYEPGSGTTIMGYAGICGSDNVQNNSDAYFHSASLDEMNAHLTSIGWSGSATGNTVPTVNAGSDTVIPRGTPFSLTASASDPDGDLLTYSWEQRDLGPARSVNAADNGSSPLFRSFTPTTSPTRTFPRLQDLLNNTTVTGETLPTLSRSMTFRVTVRDNRAGGGGVESDDIVITVDGNSGPFLVTSPNSAASYPSGPLTVTWNVAGTTNAPVSASTVTIRLSEDGGVTFPHTLASGTANDGSETVSLPLITTSTARIGVFADNRIFFDVSNADFTITAPPTPSLVVEDLSVTEGDAGSSTASIRVTLTPTNPSQTVTVDYTTADASATAGADYTTTSGTLTFPPGQSLRTIPVPVLGDVLFEGDEAFVVNLSNPQNATLLDAQGQVTIEENDLPPPVITSSLEEVALVGAVYSYQITSSSPPDSYELVGTLPAGLSFSAQTGILSGTPTAPELVTLLLSVTNTAGTDTRKLLLQTTSNLRAVALDQPRLEVSSSGDALWFRQTTVSHDGVDALQSGSIGDNASSTVETTVTGPDTLAFWWKVSSEATYDFLQLLIDGDVVQEISGEVNWQQVTARIQPGRHTVQWRYIKDSSAQDGSDAGWVDEVTLASSSTLPFLSMPASVTAVQGQVLSLFLTATGSPTTYDAIGLPAGLLLNGSTGEITGTPTGSGTFQVSVTVTNDAGSSSGSLEMRIGSASSNLANAIDQPGWTVITGGNAAFTRTTSTNRDGTDAAASGTISDSQQSWMSTTVQGPATLTFWWQSDSENFYDPGTFLVNGQNVATISGNTSWMQVTQNLGPGSHVCTWLFSRDAIDGSGANRVWVDEVDLQAADTPFLSWINGFSTPFTSPTDDPEGDRVFHLIEYAFNLNPLAADANLLPPITINAQGQLEMTFDWLRPELTYQVIGSDDLITWSPLYIELEDLGSNRFRATDLSPLQPGKTRFMGFQVIAP